MELYALIEEMMAAGGLSYIIILGGFGLVQAVVVAVIAGLFNRESKRRRADNEAIERRARIRTEESRLSMRLMSANASLAVATGLALKEGRTNGKMEKALLESEKAQHEYYAFINKIAATQMTAE